MTGTVATPAAVAGMEMSGGQTLSPLHVNSFRISAVTSRLLAHVRGQANADKTEFCNLCLSLARGIDYAVSNNDIPGRALDLPYLLKQVCQLKTDLSSLAAIMVLMISVKSACNNGWFSEKVKDELYTLSDEMQSSFCSVGVDELNSNVKEKENYLQPTISRIMSRFYPGMKMGEIFSLVETKPGYDSYVTDLHISKSSRTSPHEKLYLFVAQTDNMDTSACLITPPLVNFLLNGEGVNKRTCITKDLGPQMPTHVTHMLKYGSNLLQVVGQFNGRYVIVIAFMSLVSNPSPPTIDYVSPVAAQTDSDNEIIEGPSRVSLKCPISFSRITIPVKGHTCKHLQCFDYNNYVEINSRRPMWRCPHCGQSVCFSDIRIDQTMVKVLKEVGEDVSRVKISADGSWEAVTEANSNELTEKPNNSQPLIQESTTKTVDDIMDLTENDKDDDRKASAVGESSENMKEKSWRELYSSALETIQKNHLLLNSSTPGQSQSQSQSQTLVSSSNTQSQQNGHVRYGSNATWVKRTAAAIQALPAQTSSKPVDSDFSRSHLKSSMTQTHHKFPQSRHTSPLSTNRFSTHQIPSMSQRAHLPARSSGQPVNHSMTSHYSLASIQRATSQTKSQTPSIQTSGSSTVPVPTSGDKRGSSVDGSAEENWRPTGRMRGSLSGMQYSEALKTQTIIKPSQPVQPARPPPVLNTPRPFIPPHLQALMANNNNNNNNSPRPPSGGSSPGSDGGDK